MGIAAKLGNFSKNMVIGGATTDSWTEFYLAMALDFEQVMVTKRITASAANVAISKNTPFSFVLYLIFLSLSI
jgi:hypothetical protein